MWCFTFISTFKARLDRFWEKQEVRYNWKADILYTGSRNNVELTWCSDYCILIVRIRSDIQRIGHRGPSPASSDLHYYYYYYSNCSNCKLILMVILCPALIYCICASVLSVFEHINEWIMYVHCCRFLNQFSALDIQPAVGMFISLSSVWRCERCCLLLMTMSSQVIMDPFPNIFITKYAYSWP